MKKITFYLFAFLVLCFSWQAKAQFTESFDTEIPATWTVVDVDGGNTWVHSTAQSYAGGGSARITYNSAAHDDYLISPQFTVTAGVSDRISFWAASYFGYIESFEVLLSTTGVAPGDFSVSLGDELASEDAPVFEQFSYDLSAYDGTPVYIAIKATGADQFYLYIDEFVNDAIPSCLVPSNLAVVPGLIDAELSWDAVANASVGYEWVVMSSGDAPDTATAVATGTVTSGTLMDTASGLADTTTFDAFVRADCDTDGMSDWSAVVSFTTLSPIPDCAINPIPADGAVDVPTGNVTFSWEAPTTGPTPTSYNLYAGETPTGDDYGLIGNYTDLNAAITLTGYDTLLYWIVKPVNGVTEAVGCPVWSFTTQSPPLGAVCENAIVIASVPYNTTDDTAGYGDDYENGSSSCSDYYMSGDDVVYSFTPASNGTFTVSLTNIGSTWSGIHVLDGCPGTTPNCMGFAGDSTTDDRVFDVNLVGGTTYYIVISTWATPQSTTYTLDITQLNCTGATVSETTTTSDCNTNEFFVNVDITDVADATEISDGVTTYPVTGTGITQAGPYAFGTSVDLTLVHSDMACDIDLGTFLVEACPPANDDCGSAIMLTPGTAFATNPVDGSVVAATLGGETASCGSNGPGVWYSVVIPADGIINIETGSDMATGNEDFDSVIEAFSGTCGSLTSIGCNDDSNGIYSLLSLSSLTPGSIIYIRVWEYNGDESEPFSISAYNPALSIEEFQTQELFTYYPNPVNNALTLKAQQNIQDVAVYNMLGQEVLRLAPNTVSSEVNMTSLQTGAYFVKVMINNTTETIRIIKN